MKQAKQITPRNTLDSAHKVKGCELQTVCGGAPAVSIVDEHAQRVLSEGGVACGSSSSAPIKGVVSMLPPQATLRWYSIIWEFTPYGICM
jgi:hypothetical protein